jgi:hypothetical protein
MALNNFFYDGQVRRFITQFIRIVSNFQVEFGANRDGNTTLQRVPVIYGNPSRQAASIIRNNSENYLNTVPAMAVYVSGLTFDRARLQNPTHVGKMFLRERQKNPYTGEYTTDPREIITVERLMPRPWKLNLKLDMWTSNEEQKFQLLEQIGVLFAPDFEIQSTDNYVDWSSLSHVLLTDVTHSSRTVPVGTNDSIDIATMTFEMPIWLTPPARVLKMGVIHKIINSIYESDGSLSDAIANDELLLSRQYFTPLQYGTILLGNEIQLVRYDSPTTDPFGDQIMKKTTANVTSNTIITLSSSTDIREGMITNIGGVETTVISVNDNQVTLNKEVNVSIGDRVSFTEITSKIGASENWRDLINLYGNLVAGSSKIKFEMADGNEIVGSVAYHPQNQNVMLWSADIDTLPQSTLEPINAIINPQKARINNQLPEPVQGTRYLLTENYNQSSIEDQAIYNWSGLDGVPLQAFANDIIEYNGRYWVVVFQSSSVTSTEYVTNLTTMKQYRWDGKEWSKSYEGYYNPGQWQLIL